jgi:hypothetical protein
MHMTHNFDVLPTKRAGYADNLLVVGKESFGYRFRRDGEWKNFTAEMIRGSAKDFAGGGEIREFRLHDTEVLSFATVEPMHGNQLVFYTNLSSDIERHVLTEKLTEGHALACGDARAGSDQVVAAGAAHRGRKARIGLHIWTPLYPRGGSGAVRWMTRHGL